MQAQKVVCVGDVLGIGFGDDVPGLAIQAVLQIADLGGNVFDGVGGLGDTLEQDESPQTEMRQGRGKFVGALHPVMVGNGSFAHVVLESGAVPGNARGEIVGRSFGVAPGMKGRIKRLQRVV